MTEKENVKKNVVNVFTIKEVAEFAYTLPIFYDGYSDICYLALQNILT